MNVLYVLPINYRLFIEKHIKVQKYPVLDGRDKSKVETRLRRKVEVAFYYTLNLFEESTNITILRLYMTIKYTLHNFIPSLKKSEFGL